MKKKGSSIFIMIAVCLIVIIYPFSSMSAEKENENVFGENGEYGSVYGAEYDPKAGNTSKWMTVKLGDNGIRIIGDENNDIVLVDKHGGVYVKGTLFVNDQAYIPNGKGLLNPEYGFLYFLIVVNLVCSSYLFYKMKK